jgi:cobalt-zinc-cadmium efflux system membrane fusion protein
MVKRIKYWARAAGTAVPALLVCAVLAGVAYWGHMTGWQAKRFSEVFPALAERLGLAANDVDQPTDADEKKADAPTTERADGPADWCERHGIAESLCTTCHPDLATRPGGDASPGFDIAVEPSHDRKQCRTHLEVIRFPSAANVALAGVKTTPARFALMSDEVSAYGVIEYDEFNTARVAPRAAGTVWAVFKRRGEPVRAGDVLALIDSAEVGKAKAEFLQAAAAVEAKSRARALIRTDSVAERIVLEADAALQEARARLFTAQQALVMLGVPLADEVARLPGDKLRERLRFLGIPDEVTSTLPAGTTANLLPVTAPLAGTVVDGTAVRGESVADRQALYTISDLSTVHVLLDFRPEDASRLNVGQQVEFRADGESGAPAVGRLHWISPAVDEKTRLVHAHAEVPNTGGRLRANAFGTAAVTIGQHNNALVVPAEAVQWEGCNHVVFVAESATTFRPRKVRLGLRHDGLVEILVGLKPGEVVATAGSHVLKSYLFRGRLGAAEG